MYTTCPTIMGKDYHGLDPSKRKAQTWKAQKAMVRQAKYLNGILACTAVTAINEMNECTIMDALALHA